MLLAIDIGNTNTVFAVCKGREIVQSWRMHTNAASTPDEYAAFLNELFGLSGLQFKKIGDVIISSVVPEANFAVRRFCRKYTACEPVFVNKDMAGIAVDIERPEDVGADRLVIAVAVKTYYTVPAVVIDFGTATTFDVINARGEYAGGVIAPGINLSVSALHHAASKLPKVDVKKPAGVIGKTTTGAIQSGIFWGYTGLIEGIVQRITKELGASPQVIATGGLAPLFADQSPVIGCVDDTLTLKGLQIIHENYKQGR